MPTSGAADLEKAVDCTNQECERIGQHAFMPREFSCSAADSRLWGAELTNVETATLVNRDGLGRVLAPVVHRLSKNNRSSHGMQLANYGGLSALSLVSGAKLPL